MTHIVILGAGYSGLLTALRLAGQANPQTTEITLINGSDTFTERIRLHQVATNQALRQHQITRLLGRRPVHFVRGWVRHIDPNRQQVQVDEQVIDYDYLVYALGSVPARPNIAGVAEHTLAIASPTEAAALRDRLAQAQAGDRVAVIGGGLTGIETVTEIAETYPHLQVNLVTAGAPGSGLSEQGQAYLAEIFERSHIRVHAHQKVQRVTPNALLTSAGQEVPFEIAVWAGSFSVPPLARESGIAVNDRGQIQVDAYLRSVSHPSIYAVGDAADVGEKIRMACATAMPMGAHAADNLLAALSGQTPQPFRFAYMLQCISLGRHVGLVQMVTADDAPKAQIFTGRLGAFIKESICKFTIWSLYMEQKLPGTYTWPGRQHAAPVVDRKPAEQRL